MKRIAMLLFGLALSVPALAWNCSDPLAERVVVPSSTSGTYGDADGQLALFNGQLYECKVVPPSTTPPPSTTTNTNTSNSNSGATANSGSTSGATSGSTSSAAGGKAVATGGSVGPITNTLSNTNVLSQKQGQKQTQSQSNSSVNNNASTATSNGDNSNNSTEVTNIRPAAASAFAPIGFPTAPCLATFGGAAQSIPGGISFGGSRTDKGCDSRATAQQFALLLGNRLAAAKILCTTKAAKRAHLTMEDCLAIPAPPAVVIAAPVVAPVAPAPQPIQVTVNVPEPKLIYLTPQHEEITVTAPKPLGNVRPATKRRTPCKVPVSLQAPMEK